MDTGTPVGAPTGVDVPGQAFNTFQQLTRVVGKAAAGIQELEAKWPTVKQHAHQFVENWKMRTAFSRRDVWLDSFMNAFPSNLLSLWLLTAVAVTSVVIATRWAVHRWFQDDNGISTATTVQLNGTIQNVLSVLAVSVTITGILSVPLLTSASLNRMLRLLMGTWHSTVN